MTDARNKKVAERWDNKSAKPQVVRTRWWQFPGVIREINRRVCGEAIDGAGQGLARRLKELRPGQTYRQGVSIGCGNGHKEMILIRQGIVEHFDLFELSMVRIEEGRSRAVELGIENQVTFHHADGLANADERTFDFVHWNNSLHHMFNVDEAIAWSHRVLRKNGVFYMDDFVGAKVFQWPRMSLFVASMVRRLLPSHFLVNPHHGDKTNMLERSVKRPTLEHMAELDPSEAADSDRILPMLRKHFPDAEITLTGGVIYHLALNDVLGNMDEERDARLFRWLLRLDRLMSTRGQTQYAVALAFK